jgi:CheY-like chemotaxis protein
MNGLEMLNVLRSDPNLSSTVVFMLTTSKIDEDKVAAYQQHVAGYIVKTQLEDCFIRVISMLDQYWRVVELPYEL